MARHDADPSQTSFPVDQREIAWAHRVERKEAAAASARQIFGLLETHKSVKVVAAALGWTLKKLSRWLNSPTRRLKWRTMKKAWKQEAMRLAKRRYRARYRERYLQAKLAEIVSSNKPLEMLHPNQINVLVELGYISLETANELARRRDYWQLNNPMRGVDPTPTE